MTDFDPFAPPGDLASPPTAGAVEDALASIVDRYGPQAFFDAGSTRAHLEEACPGAKREIALVLLAMREEMPQQLIAPLTDSELRALLPQLVARLAERSALDHRSARWAIHAWAHALAIPSDGIDDDVVASEPPVDVARVARVADGAGIFVASNWRDAIDASPDPVVEPPAQPAVAPVAAATVLDPPMSAMHARFDDEPEGSAGRKIGIAVALLIVLALAFGAYRYFAEPKATTVADRATDAKPAPVPPAVEPKVVVPEPKQDPAPPPVASTETPSAMPSPRIATPAPVEAAPSHVPAIAKPMRRDTSNPSPKRSVPARAEPAPKIAAIGGGCTRATCGSVVAVREVDGGSAFLVTVRTDDGVDHTTVEGKRWRIGALARKAGDRYVELGP